MPITTTNNEKETLEFAKDYIQNLEGGEVILLQGELGAGKTVFVKGLAQGFGIKQRITSPTFVLMKVYPMIKEEIHNLVHVDTYRVEADELIKIGINEYLENDDSVVVIEWGEKVKNYLQSKNIKFKIIKIKILAENKREIII